MRKRRVYRRFQSELGAELVQLAIFMPIILSMYQLSLELRDIMRVENTLAQVASAATSAAANMDSFVEMDERLTAFVEELNTDSFEIEVTSAAIEDVVEGYDCTRSVVIKLQAVLKRRGLLAALGDVVFHHSAVQRVNTQGCTTSIEIIDEETGDLGNGRGDIADLPKG